MPGDEIDLANEHNAKHNNACLAAHRAKMENRPKVSAVRCEDCGEKIPEKRRQMSKGCTRCTSCQSDIDKGR